jgi:Flp pilus assembly protein TadG
MKNPPRSEAPSPSESGNALVELAVSLPLFLLLILGTAEIANLAWASVQVNNAARAGAAYASISRANAAASNLANIQLAAQNEAPKLTLTTTSTQSCYCVTSGTPAPLTCDINALTNCPSPGVIQVAVQVNTQAAVTPFVHYPGLPATYTVRSQATLGVLQ